MEEGIAGAAGRTTGEEEGGKDTGGELQLDGELEKVKDGGALEIKVKEGAEVPGKVIKVVEADSGIVVEMVFCGSLYCLKRVLAGEFEEDPEEIPQPTDGGE